MLSGLRRAFVVAAAAAVAARPRTVVQMAVPFGNTRKIGLTRVALTDSRRAFASKSTATEMDEMKYHALADHTIDALMEFFDGLGDQINVDGYDALYSNGVITVRLGQLGTYVINKQPPNKQLWLSSPISGPKRYDYDSRTRRWFYPHDGETLDDLLRRELSHLLKCPVDLKLTPSELH